jgi:hypothetical protein
MVWAPLAAGLTETWVAHSICLKETEGVMLET